MKMLWAGAGLAGLLLFTGPAAAEPSAVERQVRTLLRAPEAVPSAEEWKRMGPAAEEALRKVALDESALALVRGRAASALVLFKSAGAKQTLVALATDPKQPWLVRGKAARSLAVAYGDESVEIIAPLLSDTMPRLREAAVKALGLVDTAKSRAALGARASVESDSHLRGLIQATLKRAGNGGAR